MIPEELRHFLDDATDELNIAIVEFHKSGNVLSVILQLKDYSSEQTWRLLVPAPLKYELVSGEIDDVQFLTNHPLLWNFSGSQSSLYFNGSTSATKSLALAVIRTHFEVFGDAIELDAYLNCSNGDVETLCSKTYGLFAEGPTQILERYAACLTDAGVNSTFVGRREAVVWTERGWQPLDAVPGLVLLGESSIVATSFEWTPMH